MTLSTQEVSWLLGLLCNRRQSIQLEIRKSSRSKWSTRSRQSMCWKGIRFIPKLRLKWTYCFVAWYPCQLWGQPLISMCSIWKRCSKWAIEMGTKFSMFLPQTGKGRRHLLPITSMNGTIIGRLWMHHLRKG
jgi:hypothetical protein